MDFLFLLLGLGVLIVGGEFLVKGAIGISNKLKISPLVIGMTVVAFGTSAPELIVSMESALAGNSGIAIGNVVGSNITNLALILGITVLIFPVVANKQSKKIDFPMMMLATLLFYFFAIDGVISMSDGIILFVILVVFVTYIITTSRKKTKREEKLEDDEIVNIKLPFWKAFLFLGLGLVALFFGAGWFVDGAVGIANYFLEDNPDRDLIIGVTVVAFGTSAPELVASCVAAYRKQTDIALGNLIGSNIFNILAVIGLTAMVKPIEVSEMAFNFDMIWMIGIAVLMMFILLIGKKIGQIKGAILLLSYCAYVGVIILKVKGIL